MAKTISIDDFSYARLVTLAGELTMLSKQRVSIGLATTITINFFHDILSGMPATRKKILSETLEKTDFAEFEKGFDALYKVLTEVKK